MKSIENNMPNKKEWIVGYGSLMSNFGMLSRESTKNIIIYDAFIGRFEAKRGFNTLRNYRMDIGYSFNPIGEMIDPFN
ncbi:MAG: hypothetical protein ACFFDN_52785, partial [Candidatus Hodarchaeota archaeon]